MGGEGACGAPLIKKSLQEARASILYWFKATEQHNFITDFKGDGITTEIYHSAGSLV